MIEHHLKNEIMYDMQMCGRSEESIVNLNSHLKYVKTINAPAEHCHWCVMK